MSLAICAALTAPALPKEGGWELEKYRVQITVVLDLPGGLSERLADELPRYLRNRIDSALAPGWSGDVRIATGADRPAVLAALHTAEPAAPKLPPDQDKWIVAKIGWTPETLEIQSREFDRYVQRWSVPIRRESRQADSVGEQLFALCWRTFSPLAQVTLDPKNLKLATLKLRGESLPRSRGAAASVKTGDVFLPLLRRTTRGGELEKNGLLPIPWTFLETTDVKNDAVSTRVVSAASRPFPAKRQGRVEQVAIVLRADPAPSILQLRARTADARPLVGYEILTQQPGNKETTPIGNTDSTGRIAIQPAKSTVQFVLIKHGGLLFARVPVVAGAEPRIELPLPDDEVRMAAESRLATVREDLIDVVARRNILISRARQKIEKKDFNAAEDLIKSLDDLPGRPQFDLTLRTAQQALHSDDPHVQRRIQKLFESTQNLFTQYLDLKPINDLRSELRQAEQKGGAKDAKPAAPKKG